MAGILSHVRVLDLSRILAGPWAGQILADLGAAVIKVEHLKGDDARTWGPPFLRDASGRETNQGAYFTAANRGKRSVTLDLSTPEGQDIVRQLATESDVVIENFKVGTLERFGLGHEQLCALNPGLVFCSVTGFGQDGPRAAEPAYDFLIQALGGLMSVTGPAGGEAQKVGVPIVDLVTGVYASLSILAVLAERAISGKGRYIDIAMLDVQVGLLANQAMNYFVSGNIPQRTGTAHPNIQPQQVYQAADGTFIVVVGNDGQFANLCSVLGKADLVQDERFRTNGARVSNRNFLNPILEASFATRERAFWISELTQAGVPCGPINNIAEVFADPQVTHRRMLHTLLDKAFGSVPQIAGPFRFDGVQLMSNIPPPQLGEHTDEVLAELGFTYERIADMRERQIVGTPVLSELSLAASGV